MKKIIGCISALLFVTIISFAQSPGKIVLKKGQKFIQETSGNVIVNQEAMGQSMESKIDIKSTNTIEVKDAKDTSYSLTNTITKMKMNMSAMGQDMNYDSEKEDNDSAMSKSMDKIINHPQNIDISATGKIIDKPGDEKKEADSDADMMTGMLQNILGNSSDDASTLAFQVIPSRANVGYSWSDSVNKDGSKLNTTYTIKELKGDDAIISIKGTAAISKKTEAQGMEFASNSTGGFTGELIADIKTGIVKQRNTTVETKGTVDVMGQQIPMTTKVTSEITVRGVE